MRIVIDTLELDELADSNRRTAGETHEIEGALGRGTLHTRLSSDDPGIRVAQVSARYADIQGVLRWLEANYDEHGRELLALSQQTRDSQSGPGLTLPGWPWPALPLPDLLRRWGDWSRIDLLPVIPVPLRRPLSRFDRVAAELSTLLGKGSTALPTVERGLATTTLGLFGSATRGVQSMIDRFGHFLALRVIVG
jgi:hypothetical protein